MTLDVRDTLALDAELRRLAGLAVRAVRLFAAEQDWSLSCRALRPLLKALIHTRPCFIASSLADGVAALCEETASLGLPLLLLDVTYGNMAECLALMAEHCHVYAETHWLATVGAVEIMAAGAGVERLLYGSGAPYHSVQKSLNQVLEADLDPRDKAAILGGNAVRLFGIPASLINGRPRLVSLEPSAFGRDTIDVHSHLGHWRFPIREEGYDPTRMLARMRRYGISRSILSSYDAMRYDLERGNRAVAEAIQGHPELLGYVELDPHRLEASCAEMDRYYPTGRFAGCELELTHVPCPTGSEKVRALLHEVAARGKPILLKPASEGDAQAERALALENPGLTIIHAHGFDPDWATVVCDVPNVCVEFNESRPLQGKI
jgi:predicted TIM-barrel fold metal-dependent hydrolase